MKILKLYSKFKCKVASKALTKTGSTADELIHYCVGGDIRIQWKAARDEIPAAHLS